MESLTTGPELENSLGHERTPGAIRHLARFWRRKSYLLSMQEERSQPELERCLPTAAGG